MTYRMETFGQPDDAGKRAHEIRRKYETLADPDDAHVDPVETSKLSHQQRRKNQPIARGALDYFPDALLAVSELSRIANEQHNPGEPMHWAKEKSTDHADCLVRHLLERGTLDPTSGLSHTVHVAWRALALLQTEIETRGESNE